MQREQESDVVKETGTETHDSGDESADQAATKKKKVPELEPAIYQVICEWFADNPLYCESTRPSSKMEKNSL